MSRKNSKQFDKKKIVGELEQVERRRYRATLAELDKQETELKKERAAALAQAKKHCAENYKRVVEEANAKYQKAAKEADEAAKKLRASLKGKRRAEREGKKAHARELCELDKRHAVEQADREIALARRKREEEKKHRAELVRIERANKARKKEKRRTTVGERRSESDDAVLAEIPAALVPLWRRVRGQIKATGRKSRAEAFAEYAEEHPDEVIISQEEHAAEHLARLQREHYAQHSEPRSRGPRKAKGRKAAAEVSEFFDAIARGEAA